MLPSSQSAAFNPHPGYIAGRNYGLLPISGQPVAFNAIDVIYFQIVVLTRPLKFSGGTLYVVTGGVGSSVKAAIWANSPVSHRPLGAPLFADNTGVATTSSSAAVALALGSGTLPEGFYWIGSKTTGTPPTVVASAAYDQRLAFLAGIASGSPATHTFRLADTYSSNMPTIAEGAAFTNHGAGVPIFSLTSAA